MNGVHKIKKTSKAKRVVGTLGIKYQIDTAKKLEKYAEARAEYDRTNFDVDLATVGKLEQAANLGL